MKIIILGAGQVGGTLAENPVGENNDITVVDTDSGRLRQLQDKFDLRVVQGHGSHPRVLREAGAEDADMLVAVTNSDETNMIACQIAYSLFNTPTVSPVSAPEYIRESETVPAGSGADRPSDFTRTVGHRLYLQLIEYPGALQVVNFAEGKVSIAAVKSLLRWPAGRQCALFDARTHAAYRHPRRRYFSPGQTYPAARLDHYRSR